MQCPDCKTDAPPASTFCPKCGMKLVDAPMKSAAPTAADKFKQAVADRQSSPDPAEEPLWKGSYSPKAMIGNWILAGLITVAGIAAGVLSLNPAVFMAAGAIAVTVWLSMLGWLWFQRMSVEYELTTQRFVHRRGVLSRVTNRVEVIDVDDVQVVQGFVERMFGVGTIKILSSDVSDPTLTLHGIADAHRVATLIDNARRDERRRRGLHIAQI